MGVFMWPWGRSVLFLFGALTAYGCSNAPVNTDSISANPAREQSVVMTETPANKQTGMQVARDFNIAVLEEFEVAEKKGTITAYDLFARRHPKHPKADIARQRIENLRVGRKIESNDTATKE